LQARGFRFAVCTNKLEWLSVRLLQALGLADRFVAICGQDTFGIQKPDPAVLLRTLDKAGGSRERALMVGDSVSDIATARASGIPVIAVDFGYSETPVGQLHPDRVISSFDALPDAVSALIRDPLTA
jgi:phosphoglycolate phosphatase